MNRNTGNKSATTRKNSSPLLTGILIGMVIGVAMAAGLAWYIMKSPSPFVQKETIVARPPAEIKKPAAVQPAPPPAAISGVAASAVAAASGVAASGVAESKPRFEFYKVLTDKQDTAAPVKPADKAQSAKLPAAGATSNDHYFLQAGSFPNADDAEKLKAKLALLGIEASTQIATLPDKGVWHRVRLGPYKNADEMNYARSLLKQNGMEATPMRGQ